MEETTAQSLVDQVSLIASQLTELTRVLVATNEKLDKIANSGPLPETPGVSPSGTFT